MKNMGKDTYNKIEIPAELEKVVDQAIASVDREAARKNTEKKNGNMVKLFRYAACAAAGLLVALTVGVNTSETFAMEAGQFPVIGGLAKVLTLRSWHTVEGDFEYNVEVPEIISQKEDEAFAEAGLEAYLNPGFTTDVNARIENIVDEYIAQATAEMEEAKDVFFANGGTEKEWNNRSMDIYVDYNVKYQQGNILSLELITAKTWAAYEEERYYYNLDLEKEENLTLEALLGEDYLQAATETIIAQIEERVLDESQNYFGYGSDDGMIEGFRQLSPDAKFYLNELGNVVIVFDEYEIAPGYMGFPEFEIAK